MGAALEICGWLFLFAAAVSAVSCNIRDKGLQQYRVGRAADYWIPWLRWEEDLYRPETRHRVQQARRLAGFIYKFGAVGIVLWLLGHAMT